MKPNTITTVLMCALVAALWMSGCQRIDPPRNYPETPDSSQAGDAPDSSWTEGHIYWELHGNTATGWPIKTSAADTTRPRNPSSDSTKVVVGYHGQTAAKVAAVMAANDITLPQVVAYLNTYNLDVVDRTAWMRPHWRASAVDAQHPRPTYYLFRPYIAVADTTVEFMVRRNISGAWPADVQGVYINPSGVVLRGPFSHIGWSDNGNGANSLPGVRP